MIKLERDFTPLCLTPKEVYRLTSEFKNTGKNVWNIESLKLALLQTSHNKCAYCECNLSSESKYVEVEHFLNKDRYPAEVLTWSNLLPSCKRCNGTKGSHDTSAEPIVNPYITNPKYHFKLKHYRLNPKSDLAKSTIHAIDLNNYDRVIKVRLEIGEYIQQSIELATEKLESYIEKQSTRRRNTLISLVTQLLNECQPQASYSATASTILHDSELYTELKQGLADAKLWSDDLEKLHIASEALSLETA